MAHVLELRCPYSHFYVQLFVSILQATCHGVSSTLQGYPQKAPLSRAQLVRSSSVYQQLRGMHPKYALD